MKSPAGLQDFLSEHGWGHLRATRDLNGGCINNLVLIETDYGPSAALKTNKNPPPDMFACESDGLRVLSMEGVLRVPMVYGCAEGWILIEYLSAAPKRTDYWESLGIGLARLHSVVNEQFGFGHDNYIGSTRQPNPWVTDGYTFFSEHRLRFQSCLARRRGLISKQDEKSLESVIKKLPQLIPDQPASLCHGDLWCGNVIVGPRGEPVLIDPAAHYGWAEAELAMSTLFGRFEADAYDAYRSVRRLTPGYEDRFDLYNLYHLLNHLNLFGSVYHEQAMSIVSRYC